MNNDREKHIKVFYLGVGFILICTLFIKVYLNISKENNNNKLLEEKGIVAEASILSLTQYKTSRKSRIKFYMEIAFFADTIEKFVEIDTSTKSTPKTGDEVLASIAKMTESLRTPLGNYTKVKIPINSNLYQKYNVNDKVKIKFLKDNPEIVKIIN